MKRLVNIYGTSKEKAIEHLHFLAREYEYEIMAFTNDRFRTRDTEFRAYGLSESNRGAKFHDAFIDKNITLGEYENYVRYQQLISIDDSKGFIRLY